MHPFLALYNRFTVSSLLYNISTDSDCRDAIPMLVERMQKGEIVVDHFITHRFDKVGEGTKKALEALHGGECLRAVVKY
tara:strand:- start:631 stop:867 length:237 start_codon:yes stop_codon:yes gene_type:complete